MNLESRGGGATVWWGLTKKPGLTDSKTLEAFWQASSLASAHLQKNTSGVVWEQTGCASRKQAGEPSEKVATGTWARADER